MDSNNRIDGVVLSGGGALGAYEVGVMKWLIQGAAIDPQVFAGTSVGSWNAAVMCCHDDAKTAIRELETLWNTDVTQNPKTGGNGVYRIRFNPLELVKFQALEKHPAKPLIDFADDFAYSVRLGTQKAAEFLTSRYDLTERTVNLLDLGAVFSVEPFHKLVAKTVNLAAIRASKKTLRIVATKWDHADGVRQMFQVFRNEDMTDERGHSAVLASAAIPGVFPPVKVDGHFYVDGGVALNTPLSPAIQAGATVVHVVDLEPDAGALTMADLDSTAATLLRVLVLMISSKITQDIQRVEAMNLAIAADAAQGNLVTIHRYHPRQALGGPLDLLNFEPGYVAKLIDLGYEDAKAHDCKASRCLVRHAQAATAS